MPRKIKPLVVFFALLLTMCRFYDQNERIIPIDGLGCQIYTDYFEQGLEISKGMECYYTCPDGIVAGPFDFEVDPTASFSKADLDRRFCSISPQFPPTESSASTSPTPAASPTAQISPTAEMSPAAGSPLLTGQVTMCDTGIKLISFRTIQPPPDLTGKALTVQIAGQESPCAVNSVNPSLLTCTIPVSVIFPASVVVSLDGAVVNDFIYDGRGCAELSTPAATTTP